MKARSFIAIFAVIFLLAVCSGQMPRNEAYKELASQYDTEALNRFFTNAILEREFSDSKDDNTVIKWTVPEITYSIKGNPTAEHLAAIDEALAQLAKIRGVPAITPVSDGGMIRIHVADDLAKQVLSSTLSTAFSVVSCDPEGSITDGRICLAGSYETNDRLRHVVLEELLQTLGMENDTSEFTESITYQGVNDRTVLSTLDFAALECLYSDGIAAGMDKSEATEIIRSWILKNIFNQSGVPQ